MPHVADRLVVPITDASALVQFDADGRVTAVSDAAREAFGDAPVSDWGLDRRNATAGAIRRVLAGDVEQAGVQLSGPDGESIWVDLRADPDAPGRALGWVRRGRRSAALDTQAQADRLRLLATVTTRGTAPFRDRLRRALTLTSDLLGLELALVSRIVGQSYTVFAAHTPGDALAPGDQFALGDTFCSVTFSGSGLFSVNGVGESPHRVHPCYSVFGLESYVGVCVTVRGEPWGTLTFSSTRALPEPLTPADQDLVRLLGLWVGDEIEREEDRRALAESERRHRALTQATFEGIAFSEDGIITDCNQQFVQILRFGSVDDVVGRSAGEFVAPEWVGTVTRMIREGRSEPYEVVLRRHDGTTFWAEIRGQMRTLDGKTVRVTALRDVSDRRELSDQLAYQATHDALTGLPNRVLFYARIEEAIAAGAPFAALFVDLDRFKVVNDSLGHETGDFLLATVAERLRSALGPVEGATVARLGGDEFGVVVPLSDDGLATSGRAVGQAILDTLGEPVDLGPRPHEPGASVGVVEDAERYATPEDVIRDADTAMYEAKRSGRGQFAVFGAAMREAATDRFRLEHDLRRAIAGDELRVFLQPIVRLDTGAVAGFESLVRWEHPERGLLAPAAFLPLAEELGLVSQIDEWMLDATLDAFRHDPVAGRAEHADAVLWLSVNCADTTFLSGTLRERVRRALASAGLDPSRLVLELTERAIVDPDSATDALAALHSEGIQVCIDDFGTGFSSLGLLHGLPVDGLKIDRSFVTDLATSATARAVVEGVVGIARRLGLRVVAEGVETEAQRDVLRDVGCELAQGYLFARPLPARQALALLG